MALRADGTVVVWGENTDALGNFVGQSIVPATLKNVTAIAAGTYHSLAALVDGSVVAWGDNSQGQCSVPSGLSKVVALAGGGDHTLGLKSDTTVTGWGNNYFGQIGFSSSLSNVVAVAAGDSHSLVLVGAAISQPQLLRPTRVGNQFSVVVQTLIGKRYTLEATTTLSAPNWAIITTVTGNGTFQTLTDTAATDPVKFYRVRAW
jgi:hypothetical protein